MKRKKTKKETIMSQPTVLQRQRIVCSETEPGSDGKPEKWQERCFIVYLLLFPNTQITIYLH